MENEDNYMTSGFGTTVEFSSDNNIQHHEHPPPHPHNQLQPMSMGETCDLVEKSCGTGGIMVDYMLNDQHHVHSASNHNYMLTSSGLLSAASLDRLSFADVMQFGDFGPKLSLNHNYTCSVGFGSEETTNTAIDPVYFLKFPVLNDCHLEQQEQEQEHPLAQRTGDAGGDAGHFAEERDPGGQRGILLPESNNTVQEQLEYLGGVNDDDNEQKSAPSGAATEVKSKRKRPRTIKTSEEVESQRMTHIAVERNRRKQMNEHLHVLRSLMPTTYVQRGDQASIIGGAIEFVRELEQLLQCLESQKRRRLYGEGAGGKAAGDPSSQQQGAPDHDNNPLQQSHSAFVADPFSGSDHNAGCSFDLDGSSTAGAGLREDVGESKSCIADIEVKLLGFDALIKILSRRRPGQLIKVLAGLEDLQFTIVHTNITTIEQTVLYSFNVKVTSQSRFSAEDIANSVQQLFTFIHANTSSLLQMQGGQ